MPERAVAYPPTVEPWPTPAYVAGETTARGVATIDLSNSRDYDGTRFAIDGAQWDGRHVVEPHVAPPASMFDQPDSIEADKRRSYRLEVANPQGAADPPQAGGGYVLVARAGARLATWSSPVPAASWSPEQNRPVAATIDGAPIG